MVRQERPEDREAVFRVHVAAFGKEDEARIVERTRPTDRFVPELSLVAEEDGVVVGHVLVSEFDLGEGRVLQLGPIGVLPAAQGRGVGSALVRAAIDACRARGAPVVVLEGAPEFYARFGFEPASRFGLAAPEWVPAWAFQALPLGGDVPRGRVVYPPAFVEP